MELLNCTDALLDHVIIDRIAIIEILDYNYLTSRTKVSYSSTTGYITITMDAQYLFEPYHNYFNSFKFSFKSEAPINDNLLGYGSMDLSVNDNFYKNLNCMTPEQYICKLNEIKTMLAEEYGLIIDINTARYRQLEINKTIPLSCDYAQYSRPLLFIMSLLPTNLRLGDTNTFRDKNDNSVNSLYRSSGKRGVTVKIYNKTKELALNNISCKQDYLRFELLFSTPEAIKRKLNTNNVLEINHIIINNLFFTLINDWEYRICKNRQHFRRKLRSTICAKLKEKKHRFLDDILEPLANQEIKTSIPVLLEYQEMQHVLSRFPINKQKKYDMKKRTEQLCKNNFSVFSQNDLYKVNELINQLKITTLDQ